MAFDAFLKISTIPGECTDDQHQEWIEILSFSHGVAQAGSGSVSSGGGRSAERCDHQDFSVVKTLDKASPALALSCCDGTHIPEVKLELCRSGGDKNKYMEYVMTDVIVSSVRPGGASQGSETLPLEEVTFNYGKMTWIYTETDHKTGKPGGSHEKFWDMVANKGG